MIDFNDPYYLERKHKADELAAQGIAPYGGAFARTHSLDQVQAAFAADPLVEHGPVVRVAGRLASLRLQGKAGFANLAGADGRLQVYLKQDHLGEQVFQNLVKRLDLGDFVGVEGPVFRTKTNEITVQVHSLTLLAKALLPPPDKWSGLQETELKYRQRYLDLMANAETRAVFLKRSVAVSKLRQELSGLGFMEVETPMLQALPGGAAARPFVTHHNALDMDLFLRIAPELYLKRLLVGGYDKVFEVNRNFRNEGLSPRHNPEFTMLEVYEAYADGEAMMGLTERLIAAMALAASGSTVLSYQGQPLDLSPPYRRLSMRQAVADLGGVKDPDGLSDGALAELVPDLSPAARRALNPGQRLEALFGALAEPKLHAPVFITDYPIEISPLARRKAEDPSLADRFELFIAGREIANGFSELNDPIDQYKRFQDQLKARAGGDEEAHAMDEDFVRALLHGMPPAGGMGLGVDRLVMLLADTASIRDVILFPHMRPRAAEPARALEAAKGETV
ncbi:MAG TPA: lysine--tRNA ligase [bacterium]|nr:lysine--tRNA ligase [bacterium]